MIKKTLFLATFVHLLFLMSLSACGVKADPQPPMTPAEIGHGKPLYKNEEDSTPAPHKIIPGTEDEHNDEQDTEDGQ